MGHIRLALFLKKPAHKISRKVALLLFYQDRLIVGYILEPDQDRCMFQLAGGEEKAVPREEFTRHWEIYQGYELERMAAHLENYHPLPVTLEVRRSLQITPVNSALRRKRRSA
ncbi:hypothetical protein CEB3_c17110 [Peptococcaceae bacterium CEB3]|nr:hypothetical protein CEB3_c17110 [Peptococcaceae bacterium CEB3]